MSGTKCVPANYTEALTPNAMVFGNEVTGWGAYDGIIALLRAQQLSLL